MFLIAIEVKILATIKDIKDTLRHKNRQLMNIISYLKVEDEETVPSNDINISLQTMVALDQLENTLNNSVKMKILVRLNLLSTLHVMELYFKI